MSAPVLLLDAAWRVDRVINAERGCELLLDRAVVAASDDIAAIMRSPSTTVVVPSVLARVNSSKLWTPDGTPPVSHRRVRTRDEHVCQFVIDGRPCTRRGDSVDHLVPRSLGGPSHWINLVAACRTHNGAKRDSRMEWMSERHGWTLRRQPFAPSRAWIVTATLNRIANPAWAPFLAAA